MSRKAQLFRLAPGGIQRIDGCLADDGGAIAIGNDDPGAGGQEAVLLQIADTETGGDRPEVAVRSEEHTSELQSLMRNSYAVFCLKKKKQKIKNATKTPKIHYK